MKIKFENRYTELFLRKLEKKKKRKEKKRFGGRAVRVNFRSKIHKNLSWVETYQVFSFHRYGFHQGTGKKKLSTSLITELLVEMNLCSKKEQIWCCSAQKLSELFTEAGLTLKRWVMGNSLFVDSGRVTYTKQNSRSSRKGLLSAKRGCKQNLFSNILGILWSMWDN